MSDTMLFGVLRMPYELAMSSELSRRQFWDRAQEAADEIEAYRTLLSECRQVRDDALERLRSSARDYIHDVDALSDEVERLRKRLTLYMAYHGDVVVALDKLADAEAEIEMLREKRRPTDWVKPCTTCRTTASCSYAGKCAYAPSGPLGTGR